MNNNIYVIDVETLRSPDECRDCGLNQEYWDGPGEQACTNEDGHAVLGWNSKPALGLSIGAAYSYQEQRVIWFDEESLEAMMQRWVDEQALLVSFGGIAFDFVLMRGILRRRAELLGLRDLPSAETAETLQKSARLVALCDAFKAQCAASYDLLAEIWNASPETKMVKGLNTLDSVALANGLGGKTGHGAEAPRDWAAGHIAKVLQYCQNDVYLTKALFDLVLTGQPIRRNGGRDIMLRHPFSSPEKDTL